MDSTYTASIALVFLIYTLCFRGHKGFPHSRSRDSWVLFLRWCAYCTA